MINDTAYGDFLCLSWHSNAIEFKVRHNFLIFLVDMEATTGKEIVKHVIKPAKVLLQAFLWLDMPHWQSSYLDFWGF